MGGAAFSARRVEREESEAVQDMPGKLAPLGVIPKGVSWLLQMQQPGMLAKTGHRFKKRVSPTRPRICSLFTKYFGVPSMGSLDFLC